LPGSSSFSMASLDIIHLSDDIGPAKTLPSDGDAMAASSRQDRRQRERMRRSMRVMLGFVLGTVGVIGTAVGSPRARAGAATTGRNGSPPARSSRALAPRGAAYPSTSGQGAHSPADAETVAARADACDPVRDAGQVAVEPRVRRLVADQLGVGV